MILSAQTYLHSLAPTGCRIISQLATGLTRTIKLLLVLPPAPEYRVSSTVGINTQYIDECKRRGVVEAALVTSPGPNAPPPRLSMWQATTKRWRDKSSKCSPTEAY